MGYKKELKKIMGNPDSLEARMERQNLSEIELKQHDDRFNKVTYNQKPKPRSNWYPETPDQHIDGIKVDWSGASKEKAARKSHTPKAERKGLINR